MPRRREDPGLRQQRPSTRTAVEENGAGADCDASLRRAALRCAALPPIAAAPFPHHQSHTPLHPPSPPLPTPSVMDTLFGTRQHTSGAELQLPRKVPMRVEPKSYFGARDRLAAACRWPRLPAAICLALPAARLLLCAAAASRHSPPYPRQPHIETQPQQPQPPATQTTNH